MSRRERALCCISGRLALNALELPCYGLEVIHVRKEDPENSALPVAIARLRRNKVWGIVLLSLEYNCHYLPHNETQLR
jgi:hypothetical protein